MFALDAAEKNEATGARAAAAREPASSIAEGLARAEVVCHAGLGYVLEGDAVACERVARVARAGAAPGANVGAASAEGAANSVAPKFAARCRLRLASPGPITHATPRGGLAWSWGADGGRLSTRGAVARVREAADGFDGVGWLADDGRAPHELLGGLAVMLSRRLGGGVFHAASVVLDGGVIAFVGPSGAGKSTACRHVGQAPLFSVDRLAVLPAAVLPAALLPADVAGATWMAHPLPGGTRPVPSITSAEHRWLPLAGALRVQRSTSETAIVRLAPARAVMSLRESTFQAGLAPHAERELLAALDELAQQVPVARLELRLGASLAPLLRRWLEDVG